MNVVLEFLGEGIREAGEAAIMHPHSEIGALDVGRADMLQIGVALYPVLLGADALSRAVLALGALRRGTIDLVEHGIVNVALPNAPSTACRYALWPSVVN